MTETVFVSGGAGYIGSHVVYALKQAGYAPVILDNLSTGNEWATSFGMFERGDIGDAEFVRAVCEQYKPAAALHFAAFIEVGESVQNPDKYFENNRDKASVFFKTLNKCGVKKVVFSSTAAVYGEVTTNSLIEETLAPKPINPYGQSKLEAETYLRMLDSDGMRSVTLRYFNVAGAAPAKAKIGEAHAPESHLIPRLILSLIGMAPSFLEAMGLQKGFTIYGDDYPTPDGTAVRDYIHVMDLADAHVRALAYLLNGGKTEIFNLGNGKGISVKQIIDAARQCLGQTGFLPKTVARREGDPAILVASSEKARQILGWNPSRSLPDIINDAATWHLSPLYRETMRKKLKI